VTDLINVVCTPQIAPTELQYSALQTAFTFFNRELFGDRLPPCLLTLQRHHGALGFYAAGRFTALNGDGTRTDELALNPAHFRTRGWRDVCSTLVHEMCHLEVQHFCRPVRTGYHDQQWVDSMKRIGLQPTSTGAPGGRERGYHMDHLIVEGGRFARAFDELQRTTTITWGDAVAEQQSASKPKAKRIKFVCPRCSFNALAVPSSAGKLACIPCGYIEMVAA
jgi:hypothetical protein